MTWSVFHKKEESSDQVSSKPKIKGVDDRRFLHLGLNGRVTIDPLFVKTHEEDLLSPVQEPNQEIEAVGVLDLGDDNIMYRYYLTEDAFIQVNTENDEINDLVIFTYLDSINPDNREDFESYYDEGGKIGEPTWTVDGKVFERVWGRAPIALQEKVHKVDHNYELDLYAMLYQRSIPGTDVKELLLVTAEDSGEDEYVVSLACGLSLNRSALDVT